MALPKSVCDNCINTECLWRAPTGGYDPPVMICPSKIEKPQTNADRIRAMTDEELAEWMAINADCFFCQIKNKIICSLDEGTCKEEWKFWLKSPVEEGE